jgi:hypothetical protein
VPIGILTADCLPVFLYDPVKGPLRRCTPVERSAEVVLKTIEMMKKGSRPARATFWLHWALHWPLLLRD